MIPLPRGDFFVPMEAYFDESGIHGGSKRCVIAGCSGGRQKFKQFEARWRSLLFDFGIPETEGFHSKSFFKQDRWGNRFGIYRDWSESRSYEFLDSVVDAIQEQKLI